MAAANKLKSPKPGFPRPRLSQIAFWLFLLTVTLLPVGLGGNRPLPFGLAQAALALSCLCLVMGRKNWASLRLFPRLQVALTLFTLVVAWAGVQMLPLVPDSWVHPLWGEAASVLGRPLHGTIAIAPEDSLGGLSRLITYIAVGLLAYVFAQESKRARQMVEALWASGALICVYGLIEYLVSAHKILWFDKWAYQDDLTATFVNRNHFAIYAGMVLASGMALLIQSWRETGPARQSPAYARAVQEWLYRQGVPQAFFLALVFVCIILSHSRSGLMLSLAGLGSYFFFYQIYMKAFGRALLAALAAAIVLVFVLLAAPQYSDRFAHLFGDYSSLDRMKVYGITLQALRDNPWLGYGLDGFQSVFRLYQHGMLMEFMHAHSDVLESLLDLGLPAGLLLWIAIGLLASGLARGVARRNRHGLYPCLGLTVCVIVLCHALVDFSMQIPGVVFPWAMLIGAGLAQSWGRADKQSVPVVD